MKHGRKSRGLRLAGTTLWGAVLVAAAVVVYGCKPDQTVPPHEEPRYPTLPLASVPDFMHATLFERVRYGNLEPMSVYGYSVVVNLHNTGDSTAPSWIRDYISKEIRLRGFDSLEHEKFEHVGPSEMLHDKRVAIVMVEGRIPVGARKAQRFDVLVQALPNGHTKSLAHGRLYQTDLSDHGLENPSAIDAHLLASVKGGDVFVNPAYALSEGDAPAPGARKSLLTGTVLNGGVCQFDRPITMQLRQPQLSTARLIEELMARRWNTPSPREAAEMDRSVLVARAESEGLVNIYVPWEYRGDWRHFVGVVSHMFLDDSPEFTVAKTKQLIEEAHKPNAQLADISLCWEAMGQDALPLFEPLISDPNPEVAFAAARAAAFCGDPAARQALLRIASDASQHNQLDAVRTLGGLPVTPETNHMLRSLLDNSNAEVRIAAYRILADCAQGQMGPGDDDSNHMNDAEDEFGLITLKIGDHFLLDIVPSAGPPLVYATSSGFPRLAIFGRELHLETPITFTAMDTRFSISSSDGTDLLTIFYRDPELEQPVDVQSHNDLSQIIAALGGKGPENEKAFNFTFNDVVAIVQKLVDSGHVYGTSMDGQQMAGTFELEHPRLESDPWLSIPANNEAGRPQGHGGPIVDPAASAAERRVGG